MQDLPNQLLIVSRMLFLLGTALTAWLGFMRLLRSTFR